MQADDEHQMDRSISVSSSQVPHQLQLRDADLEESDGAAERSSPDCVIVKEKDPASGLSRRLKHITMGEKNVSEVIRPSSSKHCLPTISEETNQNDWNMISSSSMESGRSVSHRSSDSEDCSFLLHSPSYYEKDCYKNMKWDDDETATNWSGSDSRSISRTSSLRSEIAILSESNPFYKIEKDLIELRRKMMSLLPTERNKVGVVPQGMRVQEFLRLVDKELELARKLAAEAREVRLRDLLTRRRLKQSIRKYQERVGILLLEVRGMFDQISMVEHGQYDEIRRQILLKSKNIVVFRGYDGSYNRLVVATALSEALNLVVCFDTVIWVRVSDCITVEGIRDEIAKALHISFPEEQSGSENNRVLINNFLANTRFLLVLDHLQPSLNDLEEIGIPHASKLSESGSMVVVISAESILNHLYQEVDITLVPISNIGKDIQFVLNAEEGLKWYRLDEVRQLHRLLFGDHLFHGVKDREDSNHLVLHLQMRSHQLMRCREKVLSFADRRQLNYVELPRTLNPQSWFVSVDRALSLVRELKQGEAPPPRLMEAMIQLQREGQILYNSIECSLVLKYLYLVEKQLVIEKRGRKVIAITGESGIGKTRLLAEIVKEWSWKFRDICAVVLIRVSDGMTCSEIQEKIAEQLTMSVHFKELRKKVKGGNLLPVGQFRDRENLLLLDDVRSILDLDRIKIFGVPILQLPNLKIVMTSRQKEICKEMGAEVVFEVPFLWVEESKRLVRNVVGENHGRMDIVNKLVELYGGGLPRRLVHIGNTIKDATLEDLMLLLDHPQEAIKKFSVGDHSEDEVCRYFLRRTKYDHVAFYSWDQITKAFDDMHKKRHIHYTFSY